MVVDQRDGGIESSDDFMAVGFIAITFMAMTFMVVSL
jgi:hypothetical protein